MIKQAAGQDMEKIMLQFCINELRNIMLFEFSFSNGCCGSFFLFQRKVWTV